MADSTGREEKPGTWRLYNFSGSGFLCLPETRFGHGVYNFCEAEALKRGMVEGANANTPTSFLQTMGGHRLKSRLCRKLLCFYMGTHKAFWQGLLAGGESSGQS